MKNNQRTIHVREILSTIEDFAPLSLQESYDNAGLICGSPDAAVKSILLTTDITEEVVDEAIEDGHNLIISHHPLTLQGLKNLRPDSYIQRCLIKAIRHELNIYSAHTNLDSVMQGVSGRMADKLGLRNRKILQPSGQLLCFSFYTPISQAEKVRQAIFDIGGGYIGGYSHCSYNQEGVGTFLAKEGCHPTVGQIVTLHREKEIKTEITIPTYLLQKSIQALLKVHPYEEPVWNIIPLSNPNPVNGFGIIGELPEAVESHSFLQQIKTVFHCQTIRHTSLCKSQIRKVAVCGGAGAFLTSRAIAQGADIYITGDYKYHDFFQAENRLIIADIGHYESEQFTKEIFYELVTKKIPNFAIQFSKIETNPIHYL